MWDMGYDAPDCWLIYQFLTTVLNVGCPWLSISLPILNHHLQYWMWDVMPLFDKFTNSETPPLILDMVYGAPLIIEKLNNS